MSVKFPNVEAAGFLAATHDDDRQGRGNVDDDVQFLSVCCDAIIYF